jgi:hypothetical protein
MTDQGVLCSTKTPPGDNKMAIGKSGAIAHMKSTTDIRPKYSHVVIK